MMISNFIKQWFIQINLFCIFILQTISCEKLNARISLKVQGMGFHRDLIYQVHVDQFIEECYVAIYLQLPSALYANINELTHLRRFNINTICVHEKANIELFAEKARIQNVIICSSLTRVGCALKLPIHQRYQYANDSNKYMNITLLNPILLLGCRKKIEGYRVSKLDLCFPCVTIVPKWREIPYVMDKKDLWTIPVGETTMLYLVTYITFLLTILCTLYLIQTIWKSVPKQHLKHE
ncbi:phosphatidylinositol-glycan biosynthesis class X protein-like isoform X1 [Frieseomelitta varia]|uniref:phosphatidylinositol-glycan biosynthesis class X protein-like isoform X1 n=1 Tax=Frieseomelitta varia TaxID=561572 RepID=UPI001CB6AA84|nr:phosphatidylinositol-glycan biosynthesis class X protein-like isoform X1 [Frieseomelitta varia]